MIEIKKNAISITIFTFYLLTVLYFTVLQRPIGLHTAQFELFWSYKKWVAGDFDLGREKIANIAMFVPFGFLLGSLLQTYGRLNRRTMIITAAAGLAASLTIEILQLIFMRGLFVLSLVISNSTAILVVLPIVLSMSSVLKLNPIPFAMGAAYASSMGICCPLSGSTNQMSMAAGYKFKDYFKYGALLDAICYVVIVAFVPLFFPLRLG